MISPGLTAALPTIGSKVTFLSLTTFLSALSVSNTRWLTGDLSTQGRRGLEWATDGRKKNEQKLVTIETTALKLANEDLYTIESDLAI
jgi:hypothetical protein